MYFFQPDVPGKNTPPLELRPLLLISGLERSAVPPFHMLTKRERSRRVLPRGLGAHRNQRKGEKGFKKVRPSSYGISCLSSFTFVHVHLSKLTRPHYKGWLRKLHMLT